MFLSNGINVLSLFDGKSSGKTACDLAGIGVDKYYAAEIDKYATQVSSALYPNIIRLGDVTKWREWDIDWSSIGLLFGGFPCQAWSMAGKQQGDKDERGMLFWVMLDIFKHVQQLNPDVKFLIENVKMKKEFEEYITYHTEKALGHVEKHLINSALVSAQNRNRYYWCNWSVPQPDDRGIMLIDILEDIGTGWIKNHGEWKSRNDKSQCIDANYHKGVDNHGQRTMVKCGSMVGRRINPENGKRDDYNKDIPIQQQVEIRSDDKSGTLTTVQKDNLIVKSFNRKQGLGKELEKAYPLNASDYRGLNRNQNQTAITNGVDYRKLTPRECFRLQTVPEKLIDKILASGVSNTQLYKIAGNGWTDEVIAHNLRYSGLVQ